MSETDSECEPVAYRWMWPGTNEWHYSDYNLHPECDTVEPLYNTDTIQAVLDAVKAGEK